MSRKKALSAIIIAKNERSRIKACINALLFADEIIVVDNGSTDGTQEVARNIGAVVVENSSTDFSQLRQTGADNASGEWIVYIDADEVVTDALKHEIQRIVSASETPFEGYILPRKNFFLGVAWPADDGMVRLIRKESLGGWEGSVHEHAVVTGEIGVLENHVIHTTHRTLESMVRKTNAWSATEARLRYEANHPPVVWWRFIRVVLTGFWGSFIKQRGYSAGVAGLIESMYQGFSMFVTYAKLWELQQAAKGTTDQSGCSGSHASVS